MRTLLPGCYGKIRVHGDFVRHNAELLLSFGLEQWLEDGMLHGPWVMGEQLTVCDAYLYTVSGWLAGDGVDLGQLPRVMEHRERMDAIPAVARAVQQEAA